MRHRDPEGKSIVWFNEQNDFELRTGVGSGRFNGQCSRSPRDPIDATGCHVDDGAASSSEHVKILTKLLPVGNPV